MNKGNMRPQNIREERKGKKKERDQKGGNNEKCFMLCDPIICQRLYTVPQNLTLSFHKRMANDILRIVT